MQSEKETASDAPIDAETTQDTSRVGRPPNIDDDRSIAVSLSLPSKLLDRLTEKAKENDQRRSQIAVKAIESYLDGPGPEKLRDLEEREGSLKKITSDLVGLVGSEGKKALEKIGDRFQELRPIHPSFLKDLKAKLSEEDDDGLSFFGFSGGSEPCYGECIQRAAEVMNVDPEKLAKMIEEAIAKDKLLE